MRGRAQLAPALSLFRLEEQERMGYKVFISHSIADPHLVYRLGNELARRGIDAYIAEFEPAPGTDLRRKIFPQIDKADCVLAIVTSNSDNSEWLNQELGYAYAAEKPIIPFVEDGIKPRGVLEAKEYIPFDPADRQSIFDAVRTASTYIENLKAGKELKNNILIAAIIFLGLLLWRREQ